MIIYLTFRNTFLPPRWPLIRVSASSWVRSPAATDQSLKKKKPKKLVVVAFLRGAQDYANSSTTGPPVSG